MPVTDADVAHVRDAFLAFNQRPTRPTAEDLTAYFHRFYDDGAVMENAEGFPIEARYEGLDGYHRWVEESYGPYEDVRWEVVGIEAVGERVVARAWVRGRPRGEDLELELQLGLTYEMRAGRIGHVRVYLSHDRAIAAATVTETPERE